MEAFTDNNAVRISCRCTLTQMMGKNNNLARCKICLTSPSSIAEGWSRKAASEVLYSTSVARLLFDVNRKKKENAVDIELKAEMKSYHYTHFWNKDGRCELMLWDIYENKRGKVINLNSFGCGQHAENYTIKGKEPNWQEGWSTSWTASQ